MNLSDTDQAPYSAPAPQTATVSDEAVQVALEAFTNTARTQDGIRAALTAALPYLTASVEVGDDGNKHYIVWNEDRTEGFITDDQSDADQVYEGELYGAYSSLGYAFHEAYGDDEKHLETVCLDAIRALSPAEPVDHWQDMKALSELSKLTYVIQHNPNCPDKYLVRLPGKAGIDLKPYGNVAFRTPNQTNDILGFGKTLHEAYIAATAVPTSKGGG